VVGYSESRKFLTELPPDLRAFFWVWGLTELLALGGLAGGLNQ
jgi:hypothetical protein